MRAVSAFVVLPVCFLRSFAFFLCVLCVVTFVVLSCCRLFWSFLCVLFSSCSTVVAFFWSFAPALFSPFWSFLGVLFAFAVLPLWAVFAFLVFLGVLFGLVVFPSCAVFSQYLCDSSLPLSCVPTTVWEAEGMVPTSGVTLHLILPHSLRCPADTYFTQVAMHYPHLQYASGQTVAFGHYEDPLPDQLATKLPVDLQNVQGTVFSTGLPLVRWEQQTSS